MPICKCRCGEWRFLAPKGWVAHIRHAKIVWRFDSLPAFCMIGIAMREDAMTQSANTTITAYYAAFNAGDAAGMLACVTDDIEHRANEGDTRHGHAKFAEFCAHMGVSYRETLTDMVIFTSDDGTRAAAEFVVHGQYLQTDPGLPVAQGQTYTLPAGAFFELRNGQISRVTTFYNLADWVRQVSL